LDGLAGEEDGRRDRFILLGHPAAEKVNRRRLRLAFAHRPGLSDAPTVGDAQTLNVNENLPMIFRSDEIIP
jgi:hypothetical protein